MDWFTGHDWDVVVTPLADYLRSLRRSVPAPSAQGAQLTGSISLFTAKRG